VKHGAVSPPTLPSLFLLEAIRSPIATQEVMLASDTAKVTTATLLRQKALTSHHDREFQRSFKAVSKEFQRAAVAFAKLLNACKFGQSTRTKNVRLAQAGQSGT
jgi:hypothetical protein